MGRIDEAGSRLYADYYHHPGHPGAVGLRLSEAAATRVRVAGVSPETRFRRRRLFRCVPACAKARRNR